MELEFKPDFSEAQERWEAFWRGENTRPIVSAVIAKPGIEPVDKPPYTSGFDGHFGPVIDQVLRWAETHEFLGEAIPFYYLEFAADHFATFLGADLRFQEDGHGGGWAVPFVEDWDDVEIRFQRESRWWEKTVEFAQALRERCDGKLMIASPTLVANLDALVAVRGAENLLVDLVEQPEAVHRGLEQVTQAHREILDALAELLDYDAYGSINRHGMYSRGRVNVPQCDFSCMISPEMFREFALPYLRREMDHFDAAEYHVDGPGALKHLEAICAMESLDVVQWVSGAGEPETQDWTWLYEKIDALGKGQIRGSDCEGIQRMWQQFTSRKLCCTLSATSRQEVDTCIRELEAMGR